MFRGWKVAASLAVVLAVTGCYGYKYDQVKTMSGSGSAFDKALFAEYKSESKSEFLQGNFQSSDLWADKATLAASGKSPKPTTVSDWQLPSGLTNEVTAMRARLVGLLDKGCQNTAPVEMAKAQMGYDCFAEQTRVQENFQPDDIAHCRQLYSTNIAKAEAACTPKKAEAPMKPKEFLVFFDWDKYNLTPEAMKIVADAVAAAKAAGAKTVKVTGFTDTSGSYAYNMGLSERRAQAVAAQMIKLGIPATSIVTVGRGQNDLLVPTPDGVREPQNRRASIALSAPSASSEGRQFVHIDVIN